MLFDIYKTVIQLNFSNIYEYQSMKNDYSMFKIN